MGLLILISVDLSAVAALRILIKQTGISVGFASQLMLLVGSIITITIVLGIPFALLTFATKHLP